MEGESPFRRHVAWGLCCAAYLIASPYFERLNNPNENVRVWATRAIVANHVLNIDAVEREWGYVNDKAKNEHHVYSGKAPGASFVGVPVLWVQTKLRQLVGSPPPGKHATTFWLRLFVVKLPLCAFLLLFAGYAGRVTGSAWARDAAVVALGMGTILYPYGNLFVGHALAAAAAFSGFMLVDEAADDAPARTVAPRMAAAGLLAGLTVAFEYQAALVSVALAVYAVRPESAPAARAGGLRRGRVAARRRAGRFSHGAVRTAVEVSLRQRRESDVREDGARRRIPRSVAAASVGVSELPVLAVVRAVRVLAGARCSASSRSCSRSSADRAPSVATPRW